MATTGIGLSTKSAVGARAATRRSGRRWVSQAAVWVALIVGAVVMMAPLLWMVSCSFKLELKVFEFPPQLIPNPFRPENYVDALTYKPFDIYLRNTVFLVLMNELAIVGAARSGTGYHDGALCGHDGAAICHFQPVALD
jgi:ABC-type glycerol-3-phosphate transport system permease component